MAVREEDGLSAPFELLLPLARNFDFFPLSCWLQGPLSPGPHHILFRVPSSKLEVGREELLSE